MRSAKDWIICVNVWDVYIAYFGRYDLWVPTNGSALWGASFETWFMLWDGLIYIYIYICKSILISLSLYIYIYVYIYLDYMQYIYIYFVFLFLYKYIYICIYIYWRGGAMEGHGVVIHKSNNLDMFLQIQRSDTFEGRNVRCFESCPHFPDHLIFRHSPPEDK